MIFARIINKADKYPLFNISLKLLKNLKPNVIDCKTYSTRSSLAGRCLHSWKHWDVACLGTWWVHSASDADAVTPSTAVLLYTRSYKRRSVPSSPIRSFLASTGALVVMMPQDCPGGSSLFEFLSIYANIYIDFLFDWLRLILIDADADWCSCSDDVPALHRWQPTFWDFEHLCQYM